jgi:hypothetical protein
MWKMLHNPQEAVSESNLSKAGGVGQLPSNRKLEIHMDDSVNLCARQRTQYIAAKSVFDYCRYKCS